MPRMDVLIIYLSVHLDWILRCLTYGIAEKYKLNNNPRKLDLKNDILRTI